MITIRLENVKSVIDTPTSELYQKLTTEYPKYWFSPKFKKHLWDGMVHFLSMKTGKFPTGLLHIVVEHLEEKKLEYKIIDNRKNPGLEIEKVDSEMLYGIRLREDQIDAINKCLENIRGVVHMPTGTGKTEVAIGVVNVLKLPTLFLVNSISLLHQTQARFMERLQLDKKWIGIFGDEKFEPGEWVTVATVQSLTAMKKRNVKDFSNFINQFSIILFDECHHLPATSFYTVGLWSHKAYFRFGLSGTPMDRGELNSMKLMAIVGNVIYKRKTLDAISDGDLCKIKMTILKNDFDVSGKWSEQYNSGIVNNVDRNKKIAEVAMKHYLKHDRVLILIRILQHGENLVKILSSLNSPCKFIHGKHLQEEREEAIKWFNDGKGVLIASGIFDEGIDIPEINTLIIASAGKSDVKTIQRIGRGLRKKSENADLVAYDFEDSGKFLNEHSLRRIWVYKREGYLDK